MKVPPLFKRRILSHKNAVLPLFKRRILSHKNAVLPLFKRRTTIVNLLIFACKGRDYIKKTSIKVAQKSTKTAHFRVAWHSYIIIYIIYCL